jgi:integrase
MSLKLVPPESKRGEKNWRVRGTYLRVSVNRSTGADQKKVAEEIRKRWKQEIQLGTYTDPRKQTELAETAPADPQAPSAKLAPTFLAAAVAYIKAGGDADRLDPIIEMTVEHALGPRPVTEIDQLMLDNAAVELFPHVTAATRNRQFYTPVSAVLKHVGIDKRFKRPRGWRGNKATSWLEPEQAFALFEAADAIDLEFGLLLRLLCYTGMRINECLAVTLNRVNVKRATIYLPKTKNSEARTVHLPPILVRALQSQPPRPVRGKGIENPKRGQVGRTMLDAGLPFLERPGNARLFRFHAGSPLREKLKRAMEVAKLSFPRRQCGFHLMCHTYGTWMHRYGGLDNFGLTRTERWLDPRSADRYMHTDVNAEALRANALPVPRRRRAKKTAVGKAWAPLLKRSNSLI